MPWIKSGKWKGNGGQEFGDRRTLDRVTHFFAALSKVDFDALHETIYLTRASYESDTSSSRETGRQGPISQANQAESYQSSDAGTSIVLWQHGFLLCLDKTESFQRWNKRHPCDICRV